MMKRRNLQKQEEDDDLERIEILKAVAQAWHAHSSSSKSTDESLTSEFDAHRRFFKGKPSRFKIEAATRKAQYSWDFRQSLWDSYEIVSVSKKLETGLVISIDGTFPIDRENVATKRRRESKNSLRSLLNRMSSSSKRFTQPDFLSQRD